MCQFANNPPLNRKTRRALATLCDRLSTGLVGIGTYSEPYLHHRVADLVRSIGGKILRREWPCKTFYDSKGRYVPGGVWSNCDLIVRIPGGAEVVIECKMGSNGKQVQSQAWRYFEQWRMVSDAEVVIAATYTSKGGFCVLGWK